MASDSPHRAGVFYVFGRAVLTPLILLIYRPIIEGRENIPQDGGVILASNHLSTLDSIAIPVTAGRRVHFLIKSTFADGKGIKGVFGKRLVSAIGAIPVRRGAGQAALVALDQQKQLLEDGLAVALYPEGSRSPDGRLYKGRTGVAFLALQTGAPVVPVGLIGTNKVMSKGARRPKLRGRFTVRYGTPIDVATFGPAGSGKARKEATQAIMDAIGELSGQERADAYNEPM